MSQLDDFLNKFGESELPALYSTVRAISQIAEDSGVHIEKLAEIIGRDASMTAHILRHTQGAYRIPLKGKHNTVNRAIVMLGFREVKALCLTVSILDGLIPKHASEAFLNELGKIFHGAIQARSIALLRGERSCEEVFTTAILSRIGHLVFWASSDSRIDLLYNSYKGKSPETFSNIEEAILGFSLADLSSKMLTSWGLNEFNRSANLITEQEEIRFDATELGIEFAEYAVLDWQGAGMKDLISKISKYLDLSAEMVSGTMKENTIIAAQIAEGYSVPGLPDEIRKTLEVAPVREDRILDEQIENTDEALFDPAYQLKIISDISALLESGLDINQIIAMTLEGAYKGVGFDRVMFALLTPNRKQLRGKAGVGKSFKIALDNFKVDVGEEIESAFSQSMNECESIWLTRGIMNEPNVPDALKTALNSEECILVPLAISGRSIGVFYADKVSKDKKITGEEFSALKQFVFQIQLALEHMQKGNRKKNSDVVRELPLKL
jgi:HD-like signal output (HDOD) protein